MTPRHSATLLAMTVGSISLTAAEGWGSFRQQQTAGKLEAVITVKRGTLKLTTIPLRLLLLLSVTLGCARAGTAEFNTCYARWTDAELTVGNARFERKWRIHDGLLTATSLRNMLTGTEWIREPANGPAPVAADWRGAPRALTISASSGRLGVTAEESLQVRVETRGDHAPVCRMRVFPDAAGVEISLDPGADPTAAEAPAATPLAAGATTGVEGDARAAAEAAGDSLENLVLSPRHLKLTQVTLMDQTDAHNELVQEHEWMLLNELDLELPGNLFALDNPVTGEGLVFVKFAPLPHARPLKSAYDCQVNAARSQVRFAGQGYPFVLLAYAGGAAGRTAVLHGFQRQLRRYQPARDGLFLSNTWGDRSRDARVTEEFVLREIQAAARMGVDVVQIDDGWQTGRTANSADAANGAWESYWSADPNFWQPNPQRFPRGLAPVAEAARARSIQLGLWFGPDSAGDGENWVRDAQRLLELHRAQSINYFKLDSVKLATPAAERNFRRLVDRLLSESGGAITLDLDVTAGTRPGYFGMADSGPIFVENRYTDWGNYWPHLTLRNLWKLSQYVDPLRLRMEFLNNTRNPGRYGDDPLAPARYSPDALFASVMFCNPLGWFEASNLPPEFQRSLAGLVTVWKRERTRLFAGRIQPIGNPPDGQCWTGFASVAPAGGAGDLLVFRELNASPEWSLDLGLFASSNPRVTRLAGSGQATVAGGRLTVRIPEPLQYLWLRVE